MDTPLTPQQRSAGLALLLGRHSSPRLQAPAPCDGDLALMLQAAGRVPDFQHLRPYRFLAARGAGLERLGQAMARAAEAEGRSPEAVARSRTLPQRAPLVIVVVASPQPSRVVPVFDQQLCAGATVLTLQLAALALGYGGIWRSGWLMYSPAFHQELGLGELEQIVGLLYLGTPAAAQSGVPPHAAQPPATGPGPSWQWL